jgi:hypothetical protein
VGLDAAHRLAGGPPDGAGVLAEVDADGLGGDVDGDDLPGVDAAEGDLLPGDHDDAGVAGPPLGGDRFGGGPGRRPGRAGAAQQPGLGPGQRAGLGAQQHAGLRVEEHLPGQDSASLRWVAELCRTRSRRRLRRRGPGLGAAALP